MTIGFNDHLAHQSYGYLTHLHNSNVNIVEGLGDICVDNIDIFPVEVTDDGIGDVIMYDCERDT
jgi:hypothetical protein